MLKYLKEHIIEELDGAMDYMHKAIEFRHSNPYCANKFYCMSMTELEHAHHLTHMLDHIDLPKTKMESEGVEHAEVYKAVLSAYSEKMSQIEALKKLYWGE